MKKDRIQQNYYCSFYGQNVSVVIERTHCWRDEDCPEPQPHITEKEFKGCSNILQCGLGKIEYGNLITPKGMFECPAFQKLSNNEDL